MRGIIKHILKEETNNFELVKNLIYTMFDNVIDLEYNSKYNEIMVYYIGNPILRPTEICDIITKYTGLDVVPYYEYNYNNVGIREPDFYIDTEEYDESINEGIEQHPREEEFNRYKDDIDRIVYSVVSKEEICGYGTEFFLNGGEDALRIVLYYNDGGYPGYDKHIEYAKDIKGMIENYLPIVEMAFVSYDSTKCKGRVMENVDEVEKNLNVIRTILKQVSWDGLCKIWVEYNPIDKDYEIMSKSTIRHYDHDESIKELGYIDNVLRPMGLIFYIYTPWYVDSCEDKVKFLNESKEKSTKELITSVLNTIVLPDYEDVICGFEVKKPHERFDTLGNTSFQFMSVTIIFIGGIGTKLWPQTQGVQRMYDDVTDEVWDVIYNYTNEAVDVYYKTVKNCGKENIYLREQKEEPKYLSLIKELVEPFKDEEGVCDIDVSYDDEDDMYSVYIVIGTEEMNVKFFYYVPAMNNHISKLRTEVKNTIKQYIPIDNLYVGSYGKPNCQWVPGTTLNENRYNDPISEYNLLQNVINLYMKDKYDWWKDIKINGINNYNDRDTTLKAEITVDEEWGLNQWREFHPNMEFPGNEGWEEYGEYHLVSLGDIIGSNLAYDIREILIDIFKYTLKFETDYMSFNTLMLIFE